MNNFDAAGQVIFHAHLHVIPRFLSDGLHLFPQGSYLSGDMERVGQQLRQAAEKI
jgi:histidine triad (HIT) family protein